MPATTRPPPRRRAGDRRSGTRPPGSRLHDDRRNPQPEPDVTYVPTHEGHITWDICREPRHPGGLDERPANGRSQRRPSLAVGDGADARRPHARGTPGLGACGPAAARGLGLRVQAGDVGVGLLPCGYRRCAAATAAPERVAPGRYNQRVGVASRDELARGDHPRQSSRQIVGVGLDGATRSAWGMPALAEESAYDQPSPAGTLPGGGRVPPAGWRSQQPIPWAGCLPKPATSS